MLRYQNLPLFRRAPRLHCLHQLLLCKLLRYQRLPLRTAKPHQLPSFRRSDADLVMLAELKPVEPAAPSLPEDPPKPAVPATLAPQSTMALNLQPAAPDRTLELNGLQALMTAQKGREHQRLSLAHAATLTPATEKMDWTTHRKAGMRLKRLMEESSEGDKFPHMKNLLMLLWCPGALS